MKTALLSAFLVFTVLVNACFASEPNALRDKIVRNTVIQGFPCAKGYAWFYPDGSLNQCTIASPTSIGDVQTPRGSIVQLWPNGAARYLLLTHDTIIGGYRVMGGRGQGSSASTSASFYRSGKLRSTYLVGSRTIQGVPCRGGAGDIFSGTISSPIDDDNHVEFYEDGNLRSCKLTQDYGGQKSGLRLVLPD